MEYTPLAQIMKMHGDLRTAFKSGKTRSLAFRKEQLLQLCYLLEDNHERFAQAFRIDLGRPSEESELVELTGTLTELKDAYDNVEKWASPEKAPFSWLWFAMSPRTRKEPKGTVLIIGPFNYPVYLIFCPLAAAIAAGNTVLLKPSELCEATALLITELLPQYLDPEIVSVVNGGVHETTKVLELPFDHILYTGNGHVGRIICAAAAKHLTPVTLELGGKTPCVIDPECDMKTAAKRLMWGKLLNGGQVCLSPDYVLVPATSQDAFISALKAAYYELHPVNPRKSGLMARMVNTRHTMRVKRLLDDSRATIVIGGEVDIEACYVAPTILRDVARDDAFMSEEIFGPILPVIPVKDVDEAIAFINEGDRPLSIYIFSSNASFKAKVIDNTQSGTVLINDTITQILVHGLPFGGIGPSGHGYTTGKYAFDQFTHLRAVADSPNWLDPALLSARYTPYMEGPLRRFIWIMRPRLPPRRGSSRGLWGRIGAAVSSYAARCGHLWVSPKNAH